MFWFKQNPLIKGTRSGLFVCADSVMALLRELGRGYQALCSYSCREAINILTSLPPQHYNTGWVLTHVGRAYFELAEYMQVRPLEPRGGGGRTFSYLWRLVTRWACVAGGAAVQRGAPHRVVPSGRHGDLLHHAVAPAEGRGAVGAGQGPDGHGQELPRGEGATPERTLGRVAPR